ncbi:glycosyltransferase family 25 protein [[Erwinia] mediterraneensis]|uniref:glycosyltransferase family 25 protein n=1 Tax=[Erwinia] mediterraneensis TaxID=2161819 RepID=UPI00102FFEAE|nr:glycosyltransferase family 25 protein [[Erwinia] mediterraneensis]
MKTFIVNLEKDISRRENILHQCRYLNIEAEIVPAIDGRILSPEALKELIHPVYSSGMTRGEIGCALSHYYIYKKMVSERIDTALILEDDVKLTENLPEVLSWYTNYRSDRPEVMLLSEVNKHIAKPCAEINKSLKVVKVTEAVFTHAYIINLAAAAKLAEFLFPVWLEADRWTFIREYGVVNIKAVVPPVGLHSELSEISTIWVSEDELAKRKHVEKKRSQMIKIIRKNRPLLVKIKNAHWRLFVRKFVKIEQRQY